MTNHNSTDSGPKQSSSVAKKSVKAPGGRKRGGMLNLLLVIGIIVTIGLFVWAEQQRRDAQQQLEQTATELEEVRQASQRDGQEVAQQVLERVRKHMTLPDNPQPTVATIVDIERLREANPFYEKADNGDHLIITAERAVLYDPEQDIIIDVVPVSIDQEASNQQNSDSTGTTGNQISPAATPASEGNQTGSSDDATDETNTDSGQ